MATSTVGLDIGRTAIKAVRFRKTFLGRETVDFLCQDIPLADQNLGEVRQSELLNQFVLKHRLSGSRCMTAMPCSDLMIRTVTLPFQDARKLMQVIPSEVESMIPLPLEDVAVDYELLTQKQVDKKGSGGSANQVLVAAVQRSTLMNRLQYLSDAGVDPDAVRVDALALFSMVRRMSQRQAEPLGNVAIIDLGATRTTICLCHEGNPRLLRSIRYGTNHLNQSGQIGHQRGTSGSARATTAKRQLTIEHLEPGFSLLLRELRSTLHAYEASTRQRLKRVWFSGGGAEMNDLTALLGKCLELELISFPPLHRVPCAPTYAVAMGLALMGTSRHLSLPWNAKLPGSAINLKRVMNSSLARSQAGRRYFWKIGIACVVILLLAIGDLSVQVMLKTARLQELKSQIRTLFQTQFGGIQVVTNELDQAKAALQSVRKTMSLLGSEQGAVLPILSEIVRRFPKGTSVKIHGLSVDSTMIQIEAETDSFESMEKVRQSLLGFPETRDVTVRDARVGFTANQVLFRISLIRGEA